MATRIKTPVHLWIVGALALLWNGFGATDYLMTRMRNTDYLASMMPGVDPNATLAWIDGFPAWAQFGWGLGVWGGLLGAALMLVRNHWAIPAFAASLIGAVFGLGYQILAAPPPPGMEGAMADIMPCVIILGALALFLYARAMKARGVLR
jgi:cyanate permease